MEIWIAIHPQNAEKVITVLREFGFDLPELSVELFLKENQIIQMGVPPVKIDITTTLSGVQFDECYAKRIVDVLDDVQVNLITLNHLKANKKASGRLKDLTDVEHLP